MPEKWTGELVGVMHNYRIGYEELAKELNVSKPYVSMVLNGARSPKKAEEMFKAAVQKIVSKKERSES